MVIFFVRSNHKIFHFHKKLIIIIIKQKKVLTLQTKSLLNIGTGTMHTFLIR